MAQAKLFVSFCAENVGEGARVVWRPPSAEPRGMFTFARSSFKSGVASSEVRAKVSV